MWTSIYLYANLLLWQLWDAAGVFAWRDNFTSLSHQIIAVQLQKESWEVTNLFLFSEDGKWGRG